MTEKCYVTKFQMRVTLWDVQLASSPEEAAAKTKGALDDEGDTAGIKDPDRIDSFGDDYTILETKEMGKS